MNTLFILNDPPYGTERVYNGLRLAHALAKKDPQAGVTVFLMADAVTSARSGQKTADGFYNVERMLKRVLAGNGIAISMDGKGAWRDNVFVERLWRSVKYEEVYLRAYDSVSEARASIGRVIFGQDEVIEQVLIAILGGGHALLVGAPGLAKTKLATTLGRVLATPKLHETRPSMPHW